MNKALPGCNPPRPPYRLDTLIKDDVAETFINSIRNAGRGVILVTGATDAGKTVLATSIAAELSAGKHRVYFMADRHEQSCHGYSDANWCNVLSRAGHPVSIEANNILLLDQPLLDWNAARVFSRHAVVIATMQDTPEMWRLVKLANLHVIKTVHAVNQTHRLRRTAYIYNGLVDPNDAANSALEMQAEQFLCEQEQIAMPPNVPVERLGDAIRTWIEQDLAAAIKSYVETNRNAG